MSFGRTFRSQHPFTAENYVCPLPIEPPSRLPPHPSPLGCHRAKWWCLKVNMSYKWISLQTSTLEHTISGGSYGKESVCNAEGLGSSPWLGRSPGKGNSYPLQYSWRENPHKQRSLADYSPCGHKGSDATEWLTVSLSYTRYVSARSFRGIIAKTWPLPLRIH